jgi:hypothetical protein
LTTDPVAEAGDGMHGGGRRLLASTLRQWRNPPSATGGGARGWPALRSRGPAARPTRLAALRPWGGQPKQLLYSALQLDWEITSPGELAAQSEVGAMSSRRDRKCSPAGSLPQAAVEDGPVQLASVRSGRSVQRGDAIRSHGEMHEGEAEERFGHEKIEERTSGRGWVGWVDEKYLVTFFCFGWARGLGSVRQIGRLLVSISVSFSECFSGWLLPAQIKMDLHIFQRTFFNIGEYIYDDGASQKKSMIMVHM